MEIIGDDLFMKLDAGVKEELHREMLFSLCAQLGGWWVVQKNLCVVNGNTYAPDVGAWQNKPTLAQRLHPLANLAPAPDVWVEVISGTPEDRGRAILKIQTVQPHLPNTEFVLIALPDSSIPMINTNPGAAVNPAVAVAARPVRAPYIGYWPQGSAVPQWFKMKWNTDLTLAGCGAVIDFNNFLQLWN